MPSHDVTPVPTAAAANSLEDLQLRMMKVEELLGVKPGALAQAMEKTTPHTLGTVVVKGNRSVYHGQNDRVTLLNQVCKKIDFNFQYMTKTIIASSS